MKECMSDAWIHSLWSKCAQTSVLLGASLPLYSTATPSSSPSVAGGPPPEALKSLCTYSDSPQLRLLTGDKTAREGINIKMDEVPLQAHMES